MVTGPVCLILVSDMLLEALEKRRPTVLGNTVLIRIVAAEDDTGSVAACDFVEPTDHGSGRTFTEVLLEDFGFVAVDDDYAISDQGSGERGLRNTRTYCALWHAWPR